jgi:hypothetical protein
MTRPCTCDRCDPAPWAGYDARQCRLCWLYHHDAEYRLLWEDKGTGGQGDKENHPITLSPPPLVTRSLPCVHLGEVLDKRGCPCPGLWLRACALHGPITIQTCKTCPDYEEDS